MKITLFTIPIETLYQDELPNNAEGREIFVSRSRGEGTLPIMPKIAIVSLIKWMQKSGYKNNYDFVDIDMLLWSDEEICSYLEQYRPDIVGLSAVVSTCYIQSKRISKLIRSTLPNTVIVLGGSLSASSNLILHQTDVDLCAVGDGENTWIEILRYVECYGRNFNYEILSKINGIAFLNKIDELVFTGYGTPIAGHENPFPDYEILQKGLQNKPHLISNYFRRALNLIEFQSDPRSFESNRKPMLAQFWSSKGCVARCTFCQRSTKGYRTLDIDPLDEHLTILSEQFNVGFIHILDENFGSDKKYTYEFAKKMSHHNMLWMASGVRVTSFDYDDIKFLKQCGCVSLKFGVESGSQKILDVMEKKFTVDKVYSMLNIMSKLEMYSPLAVMVGMPGETNNTCIETGKFLGSVAHMQGIDPLVESPTVFYALPLPGTPLFQYGQRIGVIGSTPEAEELFLLSVSGAGAHKENYINLNGSRICDVIWWDILVRMETQREFLRRNRQNPLLKDSFFLKAFYKNNIRQRPYLSNSIKLGSLKFPNRSDVITLVKKVLRWFEGSFIPNVLLPCTIVHSLPRVLVYPIIRGILLLNYYASKTGYYINGTTYNLYRKFEMTNNLELVNFIDESNNKSNINISLRHIVRKMPKDQFSNKNDSESVEKYRELLSSGL